MHIAPNSAEPATNSESSDASKPMSDAAADKSDAPEGWLGDAAHASLSFVHHAASALLSGLNQCGAGPAASGSGPARTNLLETRDSSGHRDKRRSYYARHQCPRSQESQQRARSKASAGNRTRQGFKTAAFKASACRRRRRHRPRRSHLRRRVNSHTNLW